MTTKQPDNTALRTALWRALHVFTDAKPYVIEDKIGYDLIKPESDDWQERPDMKFTKRLRASIVARARFVEDVAKEQIEKGVTHAIRFAWRWAWREVFYCYISPIFPSTWAVTPD